MTLFAGKTIVVGITGGIAAYKAAELVRLLTKQGAKVSVVMTRHATRFIAPLTLSTLAGTQALVEMFDGPYTGEIDHIALAERAQAVVVAPATANIIGKLANGIADDLLSTFLLVVRCPLLLAPAMNTNMFLNPSVQENLARLKHRGVNILEPGTGELACKTHGPGRMAEPPAIVDSLEQLLARDHDYQGKRVLVTAGPTREHLDPVRFLSNPSTGKMGVAVARAARNRGAEVTLITGPITLEPLRGVTTIHVTTTEEMYNAVRAVFPTTDFLIMTAAVSDLKPNQVASFKIKRDPDKQITLALTSTVDILLEMGKLKTRQIVVGFAAETHDLLAHAQAKLVKKNLDFIAVNDVTKSDSGFGVETNKLTILAAGADPVDLPLMSKTEAADALLTMIRGRV